VAIALFRNFFNNCFAKYVDLMRVFSLF